MCKSKKSKTKSSINTVKSRKNKKLSNEVARVNTDFTEKTRKFHKRVVSKEAETIVKKRSSATH